MNKAVVTVLIAVLIAGCFVERGWSMLRAGRDKITGKDVEKHFKRRPIPNKINSVHYNKGSLYRRVKPWKHEYGAVYK